MSIIRNYIDGQFRNEKKEKVGIGGFLAFVRIRERTLRSSDVPTVYLEDGSSISDHIIRKPLSILIEGNVSDVYIRPLLIISAIQRVSKELGVITQYIPERTVSQISVVASIANDFTSAIDRVDSVIDAGQQLAGYAGLIDNASGGNIKTFVDSMEANFFSNELISIDMPYNKYDRMRITNLEIEKDNENNAISFRLDAQQVNFVKNILIPVRAAKAPSDNVDGQLDNVDDKGVQDGEEVPHSTLSFITNKFGW